MYLKKYNIYDIVSAKQTKPQSTIKIKKLTSTKIISISKFKQILKKIPCPKLSFRTLLF